MLIHSTKPFQVFKRYYSIKNQFNNSKHIRKLFFNYFINENGHSFVKSSPVIPYCDPSLMFVNAGMNQFKNIFLGLRSPPFSKIANSQKCIRVGGKHNDLDVVGTDGYHHTFFEMLGNWSFGDYFKREACELAWILLTGPYKLNPSNLYVTYFGGDESLGLEADLETADIWRTIGVAKNHIIPFGIKDNFWEMGLTGPCGPCTEIHIDHTGSNSNRSNDVNKGLSNLTELWNIVFIQFDRNNDGLINKLPRQYVDTGMGFERLTALLQGKSSNYETDLFVPIFDTIHMDNKNLPKYNGKYGKDDLTGLDTAYRIIADHGRMASICLADGMIPEENYKLRKIIRRSMILRERFFGKQNKFLHDISECVINILGETYPELVNNKHQIENILSYEEDVLIALRGNTPPEWTNIIIKNPELESVIDAAEISNFVLGYKEVLQLHNSDHKLHSIPAKLAFKLYDTYGLDKDKIIEISKLFHITVDWDGFNVELKAIRNKTKFNHSFSSEQNLILNLKNILQSQNILPTSDSEKYNYSFDNFNYQFHELKANLKCIVEHGNTLVMETTDNNCSLIFDKTCFYCEAGGQESDKGLITFEDGKVFQVTNVQNYEGYIVHNGSFLTPNTVVTVNENVIMKIDPIHRISNMKNHSATHILNAATRKVLANSTICQKSSRVTANDLKFDIFVFGKPLTSDCVEHVEKVVHNVINQNILVNTHIVNENNLLMNETVLLPGEVYPTEIRVVEIVNSGFQSREACCGTHVKNTSHLIDFCIISFKQNGRASYSLKAVTGEGATQVKDKGKMVEKIIDDLRHVLELDKQNPEEIKKHMKDFNKIVNDTKNLIPYSVHKKCTDVLNYIKNTFKETDRQNLRELMEMEIKSAVEEVNITERPWIVHFLRSSSIAPRVPLQKATRCCNTLPIIVLAYSDGIVKARCCVPKNYVSNDFNAEKWMKLTIGTIFSGNVSAPKGQDPLYVCNMKESKVNKDQWDTLLQIALDSANKFAENHFDKLNYKFRSNV